MEVTTYARKVGLKTDSWAPNGAHFESERNSEVFLGFVKPSQTIFNPKEADGYRRPSDYSCPAFSRVSPGGKTNFVTYEIYGFGTDRHRYERRITGDFYSPVKASLNPSAPNVNALRSKLLNNVRKEVLDVAMVLAEMQATTSTIVNNLLRVARSLDAFKKGNPRHYTYLLSGRLKDNRRPTDKFLRESAGLYLEWKYGIMPTVYDIAGACKALDMNEKGSLWDNPPLLVGRASEVIQSSINTFVDIMEAGGDTQRVPVSLSTRVEYKARLDYSVRGEALRGLNRFGLGLSSIPTVLYDKTPFSFVLDMALPISELIKAWSALSGCTVRGYSETLHKRVSPPSGQTMVTLREVPCTVTFLKQPDWISWERRAFPSVPMPMPFVQNPIKTGNLATVLALFTQLRKPAS